ncbi:nucleotide exchange factor GrpE [Methanoregula sp.]|uniref:nucleotide exchange factor GrpE n=1 Tax=Methanoregula sp. TaxID=2052170 RepID=UPI0035673D9A
MEDYDTTPVPENNAAEPETPVSPPLQPRDELAEQKKQYEDLNDRYLRLAADFDNYRKRTARDHEDMVHHANERLAVDILEVADNLERALKSDDIHLRTGVEQIHQLLCGILARHGITPIDALKKSFDPGEHDAVAHIPSNEAEGTVVDVVSPGYRMYKKVIRYAKVAVSKGKNSHDEAPVEKS